MPTDWPSGLQPIRFGDPVVCIEKMHAGKCPYKEEYPPNDHMHAYIICTKIRQIVWYYGGDVKRIPVCMPLVSSVANHILSGARQKLNLTSASLPEPVTSKTPLYHSIVNRILYNNLIQPMQKRGRGQVIR